MKYTINYYIFLIVIIILALYLIKYLLNMIEVNKINKIIETNEEKKTKESFTSGIKKIYRPHVRNFRLFHTDKTNLIKTKLYVFFRRWGLL